jgi:phosphoribosyl 1,2-cyclic phosphodiesterase
MSLAFSVLGSGSRGNCTLLSMRRGGASVHAMIDCGLSMRSTAARLVPLGVTLDDITDVFMTHFDTDHFQPGWLNRIVQRKIRVHVHRRHRSAALRSGLDGRSLELFDGLFDLEIGAVIEPILLAHDDLGTCSYVFHHEGRRFGFATDFGIVPSVLHERFVDLDAIAIESNYDRSMELSANRPIFVKRRVMGGAGHLSNEQSIDAVLKIASRSTLQHVVPLHLSQQCNDPRIVKRLYVDRAPELVDRLTISSQGRPTPMLHIAARERAASPMTSPNGEARGRGEQLVIF